MYVCFANCGKQKIPYGAIETCQCTQLSGIRQSVKIKWKGNKFHA